MNAVTLALKIIKVKIKDLFIPRNKYQKKKLQQLIKHAKCNSRYYEDLYKDIEIEAITPESISRLPIITKSDLLKNYDSWACDTTIHKQEVLDFSEDITNLKKLYLGKYIIDSTSGSTGEKLKVINSYEDFNYMMACGAARTWPKKRFIFDLLKSSRPFV